MAWQLELKVRKKHFCIVDTKDSIQLLRALAIVFFSGIYSNRKHVRLFTVPAVCKEIWISLYLLKYKHVYMTIMTHLLGESTIKLLLKILIFL